MIYPELPHYYKTDVRRSSACSQAYIYIYTFTSVSWGLFRMKLRRMNKAASYYSMEQKWRGKCFRLFALFQAPWFREYTQTSVCSQNNEEDYDNKQDSQENTDSTPLSSICGIKPQ